MASGAAISIAISRCSAVNAARRVRGEVHLADGLRYPPAAARSARCACPRRGAAGAVGRATRPWPGRRSTRTAPRRSTSPATRAGPSGSVRRGAADARGVAGDELRLPAREVEQHHAAAVARHHPPHPAQRGTPDLGRRSGGQDRLVQVVQHGQPLGGAPEPLLGALPLGDVGDHADRADQCAVPAVIGLAETRPHSSVPSCRRKRRSRLSPLAAGRPSARCAPARAVASRKSNTGRPSSAPF